MLDSNLFRENLELITKKLATRGFKFACEKYKLLEAARKNLQQETEALQNMRNKLSKNIGEAKFKNIAKEELEVLHAEVKKINSQLEEKKNDLFKTLKALEEIYLNIPNIPHDTVPVGENENFNKVEKEFGNIPKFDFTPKAHDELGESLKQMDFSLGAKITGSRFVVLHTQIAKLHRALIQWMLDVHIKQHGYSEVYVPYIVNAQSLQATGQLPKFAEDLFKISGEEDYYLISTGEIPVTNIFRDTIITAKELPIRFVSHTPCFRSEAGSYGKDTKGMIRQHQFEKVELVWITSNTKSYEALEELTNHAAHILKELELPYRVVTLCSGDLGFSAAKTYDLEVWLPSQNRYREISSCSNMEDFQARRLKARFRHDSTSKPELVHTLNGSGLAIGRTLVAILENYQQRDGKIKVPKVLQSYMNGLEYIG